MSIKLQKTIASVSKFFIIFFIALNIGCYVRAQSLPEVKGKILNEEAQPISATIRVKGTNKITGSDEWGSFSLKDISANSILLISGINIETIEVPVNGRPDLGNIIVKQKIRTEEEVLIAHTGYQSLKPNEVNGSIVVIDKKTLNEQVGTNILRRLDNVTSGLMFKDNISGNAGQNKTRISIRGMSTINGHMDPLIVLDGFVYEGDINNINPNDVENITILKDAAASSIWGARAGNGVIVITTNKGKFNQKLRISANSSYTTEEKPDLFYLPVMFSSDQIEVEQFLFERGYFNSAINSKYLPITPAVEIFDARKKGLISAEDSSIRINQFKTTDTRNDYNKYIYQKATTWQNSLILSGGSEKNAYSLSFGYNENTSNLNAQSKKLNIKMDNSFQISKKLRVDGSVYFTNSKLKSGESGYDTRPLPANRNINYYSIADKAGNPLPLSTQYKKSYTDTAGGGKLLDWSYYPLLEPKLFNGKTSIREIFANAGLQYKILPFLNLEVKYQYQNQNQEREFVYDAESFYVRNLVNNFSQIDRSSGVVKYIVPLGAIRTLYRNDIESHTLRGQFNFNKSWSRHVINSMIGSEMREAKISGDQYQLYGYKSDPLQIVPIDYVNRYPTYVTGGFQTIGGNPDMSEVVNRFISLYGNVSYIFNNKYSAYASARKEGSNIFGVSTNNKWKPLWSGGISWDLSKEQFYHLNWMPQLRLKISYGYSGNVDLSKTALAVGNYHAGSTGFPYIRIRTINNPNLKWEQVGQFNLGAEFNLKNNILSGSIEFYQKTGTDLYGEAPYDFTSYGYVKMITRNVAAMKGKGIDIILNTRVIDRAFRWNTRLLFSSNQSKTTEYFSESSEKASTMIGNNNAISTVVGMPLYGMAAYKWGGLDDKGNPQGYVDGKLSTDYQAIRNEAGSLGLDGNMVFKGSSVPLQFGSLTNSFSFTGITLSVNLSYRFNYYFRKSHLRYGSLFSGSGHPEYANRWQISGDELITNVPSLKYPVDNNRDGFYSGSEIHILKADHIRLQYINLVYNLKDVLKKQKVFQNLDFYMNIFNPGIIWKANKESLDPDYPESIRPVKSFTIGFRCNL